MADKKRPAATPGQAQQAMDRMIAAAQSGQQDIARRLGLNITDLTCMGFVIAAVEAGESPSPGDLAEKARLTTGAVTGVLNRLEKAGYVRRAPDPDDRRRLRITVEESAARRLRDVYGPFYQRLAALFAGYSATEVALLTDAFTRVEGLLRESSAELDDEAPAS
ncbi:MarR family transcriptional regulator [Streptomyces solincola]|uniref:MarR family transcriptional regulator n=1 Tax=Streptomyces solincola TaxID=2100817 RepID=A0A2S9PXK1_9ACTN|nr:MarR family transcriptional regulator [Streptomyces solincola]PRH79135.1 MarR family transcriptional regulator [Streptomyces solincola]